MATASNPETRVAKPSKMSRAFGVERITREVIGTVRNNGYGDQTPTEAAFAIIAKDPQPGRYEFTTEPGVSTTIVTIAYTEGDPALA